MLACLGFWLLGVGTGLFFAWLWLALREDRRDVREERSSRGGAAVVGLTPSEDFVPPAMHLDSLSQDER